MLACAALSALASCANIEATQDPGGDYDVDTGGWSGYAGYVFGHKSTEGLGDAKDAVVPAGFDLAVTPPGSPIALVLQLLVGFVSDGPDEAPGSNILDVDSVTTTTLNVGVRKVFGEPEAVRPFIGGGLSLLDMVFEDTSALFGATNRLDADQSLGYWVGAGAYFALGRSFTLGFAVQQTIGHEVALTGRVFDADSLDLLGFIGARF
ncbi:MAG: hypothetical protein R3F49_12520 [Planctomycetota bacterium]